MGYTDKQNKNQPDQTKIKGKVDDMKLIIIYDRKKQNHL